MKKLLIIPILLLSILCFAQKAKKTDSTKKIEKYYIYRGDTMYLSGRVCSKKMDSVKASKKLNRDKK